MSSDFERQTRQDSAPRETIGAAEFDILGDYRIVRQLGAGGMGCVYLATDEKLHRTVALKVLQQSFVGNDEARERFFREARAAAALNHDNIVTIYQVGEDQGTAYLAMEHLEGNSLEDWLRPDRRASLPQIISIGKQTLRALAAAHGADVIHRDIKPDNIWLESNGRIKILDFGIAQHITAANTKLTHTGAVMGTPAFMSPEQARGEQVDHRTDLFSFGCVLYRMATGRLPFQAEGGYGVIAAILSEQQQSPNMVNPTIPQSLSDLIDHLLSKSSSDRPDSAESALATLKEIESKLEEKTVTSPIAGGSGSPPKLRESLTKPSSGKFGGKATVIGLTLLLALGGIGLWFASGGAEKNTENTSETQGSEPSPSNVNSPRPNKANIQRASPATPSDATNAQAASDPIDLLQTADVEGILRGVWRRDGDAIIGFQPKEQQRFFMLNMESPIELPDAYCVKMRVQRISRQDGPLLVTLKSGPSDFTVKIDAKHPDRPFVYTGFNADLPKKIGSVLPTRVPIDLVFWVTKSHLKVTANGNPIFKWSGGFANFRRIGLSSAPFAVGGAHPSAFRFEHVTLIPNATEPETE